MVMQPIFYGRDVMTLNTCFKKAPLKDAIGRFSHDKLPNSSVSYYGRDAYVNFGLLS